MSKALDRAIARYKAQMANARPRALAVLEALRSQQPIPEIPPFQGDIPEHYPYSATDGDKLAFVTAALPEHAPEIEGLWLSR